MLVEVMRADASFAPSERKLVREALAVKFRLAEDESERLAELAEATAQSATDLYTFTSRIDERFDIPRKVRMIECMWQWRSVGGERTSGTCSGASPTCCTGRARACAPRASAQRRCAEVLLDRVLRDRLQEGRELGAEAGVVLDADRRFAGGSSRSRARGEVGSGERGWRLSGW
jgi:hypothetical protein